MPARSLLLVLFGLVCCLLESGCAGSSQESAGTGPDSTLVDVGDHRLLFLSQGSGSPVVVIDVGVGESRDSWRPIVEKLASVTRVCMYNRSGYGESEPGTFPRTAGQCAHELSALLTHAPVKPPYLLVGHSLGALHCMLLAAREPENVAGLVLLDPPPRDFIAGRRFSNLRELAGEETERMRRAAEQARRDGDEAQALFLGTVASEHESMFRESAAQIDAIEGFGDLPLVVIASGIPNPMFGDSAIAFQDFWVESSRELAAMSSAGEFFFAAESGHHIQRDAPDLTLDAIELLVKLVRETNL